jgi:hypothetical protein
MVRGVGQAATTREARNSLPVHLAARERPSTTPSICFELFCEGEADVADASRPIEDEEAVIYEETASSTRSWRSLWTGTPS